ncbi:hypothetical protein [Fontivita pretiosa]|uniref:hypothetical protein n=1 Tax=Fontivita pretiosa TaxID=2989684 RepID=UPI003D17A00C
MSSTLIDPRYAEKVVSKFQPAIDNVVAIARERAKELALSYFTTATDEQKPAVQQLVHQQLDRASHWERIRSMILADPALDTNFLASLNQQAQQHPAQGA